MDGLQRVIKSITEAVEIVYFFLAKIVPTIVRSTVVGFFATLVPYEIFRGFYLIVSQWQELRMQGINAFVNNYLGEYSIEAWKTYLLIVFVLFVLYVPAKEYNRVRKLAGKFDWMDIEIKPHSFPPESVYGKGVRITNNKDFTLSGISARIVKLRYLNKKGDYGMSDNVRFLGWVMEDETLTRMPQRINKNGGKLLLQIVQWNEKEIWIATGLQELPTVVGPTTYKDRAAMVNPGDKFALEIELTAEIDGQTLQKYVYSCELSIGERGRAEIIV